MTASFTRALGEQAGVQLNPLVDNSEMPVSGNADQSFAIAMRATRGRIDKAFSVDSSNFYQRLGYGETLRANALNEAWVQVFEALNNGSYSAAVSRLVGPDAKNNWVTIKFEQLDGGMTFGVAEGEPANYDIAVKHLECFNDGIKLSIHADENRQGGSLVANDNVTLVLSDSKGVKLYEFSGSLTPGSQDDYGRSDYLPDVIEQLTSNVEVKVSLGAVVPTTSKSLWF